MLKAILFAILVALAVPAAAAQMRKPVVISQPPSPNSEKAGSLEQQKTPAQKQPSADEIRGTQDTPLIIELKNSPNTDTIAAELAKDRNDHASSDRWNWIFSLLLVLVGAGQGGVLLYTALVTNKAANAAKDAAEALPLIERAYIFGGFGGWDQGTGRLPVSLNNYGKTPGLVGRISLNVVPLIGMPQQPTYPTVAPNSAFVGFQLAPQQKELPPNNIWGLWSGTAGEVFYGRIWYTDIFGKEHFSSFALILFFNGTTVVCTALDMSDFPEYWATDQTTQES